MKKVAHGPARAKATQLPRDIQRLRRHMLSLCLELHAFGERHHRSDLQDLADVLNLVSVDGPGPAEQTALSDLYDVVAEKLRALYYRHRWPHEAPDCLRPREGNVVNIARWLAQKALDTDYAQREAESDAALQKGRR